MNFEKSMLRLYAVTDRTWLNGRTLETVVEEALQAGVTMVQLREKSLPKEELLQEALRLKEVCHRYHVSLLIDDDVEICALADADGVHVGQSDMAIQKARQILGPSKIIGATAHNTEEAIQAERAQIILEAAQRLAPPRRRMPDRSTAANTEESHPRYTFPCAQSAVSPRTTFTCLKGPGFPAWQ